MYIIKYVYKLKIYIHKLKYVYICVYTLFIYIK